MKKSDLKSGMIVELKDGNRYVVMKNTSCGSVLWGKGIKELSEYTPELKHKKCKNHDIIKIFDMESNSALVKKANYRLLWDREVKIVFVSFPNHEKEYAYKVSGDIVNAGDKVYVPTKQQGKALAYVKTVYNNIQDAQANGLKLGLNELKGIISPVQVRR